MYNRPFKVVAALCILAVCCIVLNSLYTRGISILPVQVWVLGALTPSTTELSTTSTTTTSKVKSKQTKPLSKINEYKTKQPAEEHGTKKSQSLAKVPTNHSANFNTSDKGHRPKKKYLIYLCDKGRSCGGWGDRQRGMMAAYVLALVTGRTFGINMSYPCDIKLFYVPNQVNWYIKVSELRNLTWEMVDWVDNRNKVVDCESDFNVKYPSDVVFLKTNQDVIYRISKSPRYAKLVPKEYQNPRTAFGNAWRKTMKLSLHMEEHVDLFMSKIPKNGKLVCGHVRMRKSKSIPNDSAAITTFKNLNSMWNLLARYEKNASRIFIASDSLEARSIARKRFKDKELDTDGLVLHIDRQGRMSDACIGFEMALLEQVVLSRCDVLVKSPSGFSSRAAMMSTIKQELFTYINGTIKKG